MHTPDTRLYLNSRIGAPERVLEPATVVEPGGDLLVVRPDDVDLEFEHGQKIEVCFARHDKFSMQVGRVFEITPDPEGQTIGLVELSEPTMIEMRQHYRVVTLAEDFTVHLAEIPMRMADVSVCGLSVISDESFDLEDVALSFEHDGRTYAGRAAIRSIKYLPSGEYRYGLYCDQDQAELRAGLQRLATEMQRRQLRRRSAA